MPEIVQFHFIILAAGEVLRNHPYVSAEMMQDLILTDKAFGVKVDINDCQLALRLLNNSGFIKGCSGNPGFYEHIKA